MARKRAAAKPTTARPSALLDTRIVYCGDCLEQLARLPDDCVDLIYIDPPFNLNCIDLANDPNDGSSLPS